VSRVPPQIREMVLATHAFGRSVPVKILEGHAPTMEAFEAIYVERARQEKLWGTQDHDDLTWLPILLEEVGELGSSVVPKGVGGAMDKTNVDEELRHIAAVCVAWIEARARR
jgi:hypothetical protein